MRTALRPTVFGVVVLVLAGCGSDPPAAEAPAGPPVALPEGGPSALVLTMGATPGPSDPARVRAADYSILFVGNSHTALENLPNLVADMVRALKPGKTAHTHVLMVGFLEDAGRDGRYTQEIESRPWKYVVLQAQKISMSGKHNYSRTEGIDLAKLAKDRGATVLYYPEWGRKGVAGDGAKQEQVYREMARDAGAGLAPVATAWDLALAGRPDLPLHAADGNHQSAVGAFLTAAVLAGRLTGESPARLADFPYPAVNEADRKYLAEAAARALAPAPTGADKK